MSNVAQFLNKNPQEIVELPLKDWQLSDGFGFSFVRNATGVPHGVRPNNIPATLEGTFPVLIGYGNGRVLIIDGAHRFARAILDKQKTILAVILTEEETRSCVRAGQMERFDHETRS